MVSLTIGLDAGALLRLAIAMRQNHVDMVARDHEAAGTGLRADLGRDRAHSGGQNRGQITRRIALHEARFLNRLAGIEGAAAHDRAGDLFDGIRPVALANEVRTGGRSRPQLPAQLVRLHHGALADIAIRDQHIDGRELRDRSRRRRPIAGSTREQRRKAAGGNRNPKDDKPRGFHTLHFPRMTQSARHGREGEFHHPKVNSWLMSGLQTELIFLDRRHGGGHQPSPSGRIQTVWG